jgi:integrase
MVVRKRKNFTSYQIMYWNRDTWKQTVDASFRDKVQAMTYLNKMEIWLNRQGERPERPDQFIPNPARMAERNVGRKTASAALEEYLNSAPTKEKTRAINRRNIERFYAYTDLVYVDEATTTHVDAWCSSMWKEELSKATIAQRLRSLKAFLEHAGFPGVVTAKQSSRWGAYSQYAREKHFYTKEEFDTIISAIGTYPFSGRYNAHGKVWWIAFVTLLYDTGLRFAEACHLRWEDLDFDSEILRVTGRQGTELVAGWTPKSKRGERILPMTKRLIRAMTDLQGEAAIGVPYCFVGAGRYRELVAGKFNLGTRGDLLNGVYKKFVMIRKYAGITEGDLHSLRGTFITEGINRGLSPKDMQYLAGHSNCKTTLDIYTRTIEPGALVSKARAAMDDESQQSTVRPPIRME